MRTFSNAIACTSVRFELFDPAEAGAEVRPVIATQRKGVPVSPRMVITAGNLASQLAPLALRSR